MTGQDLSGGMPPSPWQAAQACALSSIDWAVAANGTAASRTASTRRVGNGTFAVAHAVQTQRCDRVGKIAPDAVAGISVAAGDFAHPTRGVDLIRVASRLT